MGNRSSNVIFARGSSPFHPGESTGYYEQGLGLIRALPPEAARVRARRPVPGARLLAPRDVVAAPALGPDTDGVASIVLEVVVAGGRPLATLPKLDMRPVSLLVQLSS